MNYFNGYGCMAVNWGWDECTVVRLIVWEPVLIGAVL